THNYFYNESAHIANAATNPLPYHLTGITDELGQRYYTAEFDDWGRATGSWHGTVSAEKYTLTYTDTANPTTHAISSSYVTIQRPLADTETYDYTNGQPYRKPDTISTGA